MGRTVKIQLNLPQDVNRKVAIQRILMNKKTKAETIVELLRRQLK